MDDRVEAYSMIGESDKHINLLDEESGRKFTRKSSHMIASITASFTVVVTIIFLVTFQLGSTERFNFFIANPAIWKPQACTPMAVPFPRVEDMTLDEKIGQMTQVDQLAVTKSTGNGNDIAKYFIGSVLSGGGGAPVWGNTAKDWASLIDHLQSKVSRTRLKIPIVYGIDAVHGNNNVFGTTIYPHHVGLGATRNRELVRKIGAAAARETAAIGVRWAFSPAVSVCRDPRWGRCYESFSENPEVVTSVSSAEIEGWQTRPSDKEDIVSSLPGQILVAATAKHFIGDGGTQGGIDQGNTIISYSELRRIHLPPYIEAIKRGVQTIMISYSSINGLKLHANHHLVTDVLKEELGFEGVVVSDWEAIQQLPGNFSDQVRESINSGLDIIMVPAAYKEFIFALREEVLAGRVSESRIDDAVRRILKLKANLGLFENACSQPALLQEVGKAEHRAIGRQAVQESLVLLKNERRERFMGVDGGKSMFPLPLTPTTKIIVAGSHANNIGLQCGGWTIKWQGSEGNITTGTTILDGIREVAKERGAGVRYVHQPTGNEEADYGIVVVGEQPYAEFHGDNQALQLDSSSGAAIHAVCKNMPCVVVLVSGRALQVDYLLQRIDALVAAWLPGSEGNGVADALFGPQDFSGRLPVSWFSDTSILPMNSNNSMYKPLYPLGYGLSKTGNSLPLDDDTSLN